MVRGHKANVVHARLHSLQPQPAISIMGKGDKRTKKGKIYRGSYGKRRPGKLKSKAKKTAAKRS